MHVINKKNTTHVLQYNWSCAFCYTTCSVRCVNIPPGGVTFSYTNMFSMLCQYPTRWCYIQLHNMFSMLCQYPTRWCYIQLHQHVQYVVSISHQVLIQHYGTERAYSQHNVTLVVCVAIVNHFIAWYTRPLRILLANHIDDLLAGKIITQEA